MVSLEAAVVLAATALTGATMHLVAGGAASSTQQAVLLGELATAAAAAMVALQCGFLARLLDDRRLLSVATAWAYYGLVLMPLSVVHTTTGMTGPLRAVWLVGQVMFMALLAFGLRTSDTGRPTPLRAAGVAVALTAVLTAAATRLPDSITAMLATPVPEQAVVIGWTLLAGGFTVRGILRREPVWWRLGWGIGVVAAARFDQLTTTSPAEGESLRFVALRLLGFLVLVIGLGFGVRQANRRLRARQAEEEERAAAVERSRASRDHEIRNALSNLAAITLLAGGLRPEPGEVAETVTGELARLHDLLEDRTDVGDRAVPVDLVLRRLVLLRRASGATITLDCPADLNAVFPTAVLTEVLTNLLVNCDRHAPGAVVHIEARRVNGWCRIDVTDAGPGLGTARNASRTSGSGLGLALSSHLMINNGGGLRLLPATRHPTGCTARLDLPLATGQPQHAGQHGTAQHGAGQHGVAQRIAGLPGVGQRGPGSPVARRGRPRHLASAPEPEQTERTAS